MLKPFVTDEASNDLDGIVAFIARDKIDAAINWLGEINKKFYLLADSPTIGESRSDLGEGVRCTFFKRYVIFFRETSSGLEILRIIPGDRDTKYL